MYLRASSEELMRRLRYDERRPLLQGKNGEERQDLIIAMLKDREPVYLSSANLVIRTDGVYFPRIYQIINKKIKSGKVVCSAKNNPKTRSKNENAALNKKAKRNYWHKNRSNYRKDKE